MRYLPGRRVLVTGLALILVALLGCVLMLPGAARAAAAATTRPHAATTRPHAATTAASFFPAAVTAPASQTTPGRDARPAGPAAVFAPEGAGAASGAGQASQGADFIASENGIVVSTSRARLEGGFQDAGFPSSPTRSPGMQYTLPDGSLVRIMEPSGPAPLRASFTDPYGNGINPFTGKQPMPPPGVSGAAWRQLMRSLTHIELGP